MTANPWRASTCWRHSYLAEALAMDVAELITMLASDEGRDPLERLDAWDHDELPPSS